MAWNRHAIADAAMEAPPPTAGGARILISTQDRTMRHLWFRKNHPGTASAGAGSIWTYQLVDGPFQRVAVVAPYDVDATATSSTASSPAEST